MSAFLGNPNFKIRNWIEEHRGIKERDIPLYFEAKSEKCTVSLVKIGNPDSITLQTSTDNDNWTDYEIGSVISLEESGDRVYFRQEGGSGKFSKSLNDMYCFQLGAYDGSLGIECHGNIMSLVDKTLKKTTIENNCQFCFLFQQCDILKTAPLLEATVLANNCYDAMFGMCSSLEKAPLLVATTLAYECYASMFLRCGFYECHMKKELQSSYRTSIHGDPMVDIVFDL